MDPIQVRTLKPGTMPKASEWNAVVSKSKRWQPSQAGYDWNNGTSFRKQPNPFRKQTLFYTPVEIPAYSVFPVKVKTQGDVPFEVCEFDKTKIADYTDGYFGTNGKFKIPKETRFYGYFLDEHYDDPIAVYDTANVGDECGLSERAEFKADPDAQGMIITGVFSSGVYYVRKMNRFPDFFATLDEDYTVEDGTYTSVTLEDPETFIGESTIEKVYPAWNIDPETQFDAETRVIVRFDTKRGKWFFFKPIGGESGKVLDVAGPPLSVESWDSETGLPVDNVFYTEMAAGESVAETGIGFKLTITAVSQSQEATGSETSDVWIKYPTNYITIDETPLWWRYGPNYRNDLYQWETEDTLTNVKTYHIAPVKYYGQVIKGSSVYYLPKYRTINGQRYWESENGSSYIYYTQKDSDVGYCIGQNLGQFLLSTDPEPFEPQSSDPSDSLQALMTAQNLTFEKPQWDSDDEFGIYEPNANTSGTVQFGCGRWMASDGRTLQDPYYFVHVADGTVNKWKGKYICQAFNQEFSKLYRALVWNPETSSSSWKYIIGNWDSGPGCYYSDSAPSTSAAVTFTYREGTSGLKGTLKYVSTSNGNETWEMKCGSITATYTRSENNLDTLVYQSATGGTYYFRNITKSNSTWTAAGVDGTVGTLVFSVADLSTESGNDFIFNHSISLTLTDYVQGDEKRKIYLCSPGVIS